MMWHNGRAALCGWEAADVGPVSTINSVRARARARARID